jgi:sporulation integral membrane protein YtvI
VYPLSVRTARATHLPQRLCAVLYVLLLIGVLVGGIVFVAARLGAEVQELLSRMESGEGGMAGALTRLWDTCMERLSTLPLIGRFTDILREPASEDAFGQTVSTLLREGLESIGSSCSAALGRLLRATPRFLIGTVVAVMATFHLSADYGRLRERFLSVLSPSTREKITRMRTVTGKAMRRYLRAYLLLFALTFGEVLVGLWILKQPYAWLIALGVAVVDLLPVFGAGAVLIPWALFSFLFGAHQLGLGLLILYGVVTIVRQIAEPHVVGGSLGLHPFVTLLFLYVGWELFGVLGMLLAPAAALLVKELFPWKKEEERQEAS